MTATKQQRINRKRGRPMQDAAREPSGKISRSGIHHAPADVVALDARRRQLGLTRDQAKDQKAGTFIGYLSIIGKADGISCDQYEALTNYASLRQAHLRAIKAPGQVRDNEGGMPEAEVTEAYEEWVMNTKESWSECRKAIQEAQNENRRSNLWAALDYCVHQDQHIYEMIGDLRVVGNCLAKHFRI